MSGYDKDGAWLGDAIFGPLTPSDDERASDPVCVSCGKPRSAHGAHTGAFAGTTGARLLCNDFRQFEGQ